VSTQSIASARILIVTIIALSLSACVSASKHRTEVAALQTQVDKDKAVISSEQSELKQNKADIQNLQGQVAQMDQKLVVTTKDRGQLKSSLDEMNKAMEQLRVRQAEQKKRLQEFQDLTGRFKSLTDSGAISVKIIDGKMVVSLGSDVLFPSGSAKLSAAGLDAVKEVSKQLTTITGKRYQIEGHTDNVPIASATFPSNWELASARALNVVKAMIDSGMPGDRVSAASFGDTQPIKTNDTAEGRAANRRIAIVVVPDLSSLPGYDELNKMSAANDQ